MIPDGFGAVINMEFRTARSVPAVSAKK